MDVSPQPRQCYTSVREPICRQLLHAILFRQAAKYRKTNKLGLKRGSRPLQPNFAPSSQSTKIQNRNSKTVDDTNVLAKAREQA